LKRADKHLMMAVILAAMVSIGAIGCGSDSSTSTPLTKALFLKEGNRICKTKLREKDEIVAKALKELPAGEAGRPSQSTLTELGKSILEPVRQMTDELSELSAPAATKARAEAITRRLEAGVKQAEADPSALVKENPLSKAGESARAYGLTACNF